MSDAPQAVAIAAPAPRSTFRDWVMLAMSVIGGVGIVYTAVREGGTRDAAIAENRRMIHENDARTVSRLEKLERSDKLEEIDRRLARIEGKLDANAFERSLRP